MVVVPTRQPQTHEVIVWGPSVGVIASLLLLALLLLMLLQLLLWLLLLLPPASVVRPKHSHPFTYFPG